VQDYVKSEMMADYMSHILEQHWIVKFFIQNENSVTACHTLCMNGRQLKKITDE
jgi:hypothetical protein